MVRLNYLVRFPDSGRDAPDRVLQRDSRNGSSEQQPDEFESLFRLRGSLWPARIPVESARTEVGAWRVRDHQIPPPPNYGQHVSLDVGSASFARQEVATHGVVAASEKLVADSSAGLTSDKNPHNRKVAQSWVLRYTYLAYKIRHINTEPS